MITWHCVFTVQMLWACSKYKVNLHKAALLPGLHACTGTSLLFGNVWPCKDAWENCSKRGDAWNCSRFIFLIHPFCSPVAPPVMFLFVNHLYNIPVDSIALKELTWKLLCEGSSPLYLIRFFVWIRGMFSWTTKKKKKPLKTFPQIWNPTCFTEQTLKTDVFSPSGSPHSTPPACGRSIWPTADQIPTTLPLTRRRSPADVSEVSSSDHQSFHSIFGFLLFFFSCLTWFEPNVLSCWLVGAEIEDGHHLTV